MISTTTTNFNHHQIIGAVDWGGSKLLAGLADHAGRLIVTRQVVTPGSRPETVLTTAYNLLRECLAEIEADEQSVSSIGVAVPGPVDSTLGLLKLAPAHGLCDVPVAKMMADLSGKPVRIINDVNACALAEKRCGAAVGVRDFLWVTVSTGIGGALVVNDSLYCGACGFAGEIGHIVVDSDGSLCGCGKQGCLEMVASGLAIARTARSRGLSAIDAAEVARLAFAGNGVAIEVMQGASAALAQGLSAAINIINPTLVVLGGGVSESLNLTLIRHLTKALTFTPKGHFPDITKTALGGYAALIGAASLYVE